MRSVAHNTFTKVFSYSANRKVIEDLHDHPKHKEKNNLENAIEAIKTELGIASLNYLKIDELCNAIGRSEDQLNLAAFNGKYPVDIGSNKESVLSLAS